MSTLFDKYGGFATFNQLTQNFYQKLLDSPQVSHYFNQVNIEVLAKHQTNFIASALGGPSLYEGRDISSAHQGLNINQQDFQEVLYALEESLEEIGVEEPDIKTILTLVDGYRSQIVSV